MTNTCARNFCCCFSRTLQCSRGFAPLEPELELLLVQKSSEKRRSLWEAAIDSERIQEVCHSILACDLSAIVAGPQGFATKVYCRRVLCTQRFAEPVVTGGAAIGRA